MREAKPAFGDGAGLVGADRRDAPDVLHGHRSPHQRLAPREPKDTDAEEEREDDGELLRQRRDGERHRAHQGVEPPVALTEADRGQDQAENRGHGQKQSDEVLDGRLERRERALSSQGRPDDLAVEGLASREDDAHEGLTRQQARAREPPVQSLHERFVPQADGLLQGAFRDGVCLAGQDRLVGLELGAGDDEAVGRKRLARRDDGKIPWHQLQRAHLGAAAVTHDHCPRGEAGPEPLGRGLTPPVQEGVHAHQRHEGDEQDHSLAELPDHGIEQARPPQEPEHRILRGVASELSPAGGWRLDDRVGAVPLPPLARLGRGEPALRPEHVG